MEPQPRRPEWDGYNSEVLGRIILAAELGYGPAQLVLAQVLGMTVEDLADVHQRLEAVLDDDEAT